MKYVIFDFDGTLADSMPVAVSIAEEVLGITITPAEIEQYRNMTVRQILKIANIPLWKVPSLLVKGKAIMSKRLAEVMMFTGLEKVIQTLADEDHQLYVLSSNSAGIINRFLNRYRISSCFSTVYGNVGIFSKAQALRKVLKREGINPAEALYVGDEVRDIEAAKKVGMPIASVTWGYNGQEILKSYHPDYLVKKPKDLVKIVHG